MDDLLKQYRPLVCQLAYQMIAKLPANVERDDLVQVGMIGLHEAIGRFDADRGVQFDTYATRRIRGAMLDHLREQDWATRDDRRHQRSIETAAQKLEQRFGRAPRESEVAREMGLSLAEYQGLLSKVRGTEIVYLQDDGEDFLDRHAVDDEANPLARLHDQRTREALAAAIARLPDRERFVVSNYYEHDVQLKDIGTMLGVTESRACQLLHQAHSRLALFMRDRSPISLPAQPESDPLPWRWG